MIMVTYFSSLYDFDKKNISRTVCINHVDDIVIV